MIGDYKILKVKRESNLGYMLEDGDEEYLLHYREATSKYNIDDKVKVFLYKDKMGRITATQLTPTVTIKKMGLGTVENIIKDGLFLNINIPKDIFLSKDILPENRDLWPQVGDKLPIKLLVKSDQLIAKILTPNEIKSLHNNINYEIGEKKDVTVFRITEAGLGTYTSDLMYVFIPRVQYREEYRMGSIITATIDKKRENEYLGIINKQKELLIDDDKILIINYLKANNGIINLTEKSEPKEIFDALKMSKKAFKRAYGSLYKDRLIDFDDNKTWLK